MPTYVYETLPVDGATPPRRFELFQKMSEPPLEVDPETGFPVKRVISGGLGLKFKGLRRTTQVNKSSPAATACGCSSGCGHRH
ncbi:zinc ribbon domain-containing protein [Halomonas sp. DQ26W]|uniref:FmdB family zinc ribbon protein n=1 Tax=Halomonas sp. DQ26W TaxID=2282311 RepID=UPI000DF747E1|nr:zinc ribbon domain-containing protein [Halomonas sp. DQ26W]RDB42523.1 zinc ribbon domain-containing protein [Halomonas sp. DQ26W]